MFNKFDRIKIKCDLNNINIKSNLFRKVLSPDMEYLISEELKIVGLRIKVNHYYKQLHIDFSAKLLGEKYTDKINILNIRDVYKIISRYIDINPLQFYKLSPNYTETVEDINVGEDNIGEDNAGDVNVGDVTGVGVSNYVEALYSMAKFQDNFKTSPKIHKHNNSAASFTLKKNVLSRASSEYVSIYRKDVELFASNKNENIVFLQTLSFEQIQRVKSFFEGVLRIEYKCASKARIRSSFGLKKDYNLYEMLTSKNNVVENIINRIYVTDLLPKTKYKDVSYKHLDKLNTLKINKNNLEKIYEIHKVMGGTQQKSKMLKPYIELLKLIAKVEENEKIQIINIVKEKLKW